METAAPRADNFAFSAPALTTVFSARTDIALRSAQELIVSPVILAAKHARIRHAANALGTTDL